MPRHTVGLALTVLPLAVLLLLLGVEARFAAAGERKLAAALSGLAVVATLVLLLRLTLLASRPGGWLRRTHSGAGGATQEAGGALAARPAALPTEPAERQP